MIFPPMDSEEAAKKTAREKGKRDNRREREEGRGERGEGREIE